MGQTDTAVQVLDELKQAHGNSLQHYVNQIVHDAQAARQILQDLYSDVRHRLVTGRARSVHLTKAYLYRAAHNRAVDYLRERTKQQKVFVDGDEDAARAVADPAPGPERIAVLAQAMLALKEVLESERVSGKQRQVFVLGQLHGIPRSEIARQLHLSEATVDWHMTRALSNLKMGLRERGFDPRVLWLDEGDPGAQ